MQIRIGYEEIFKLINIAKFSNNNEFDLEFLQSIENEMERQKEVVIKRTNKAREVSRSRGKQGGRPRKITDKQIEEINYLYSKTDKYGDVLYCLQIY